MIRNLIIKNFKSHSNTELALSNINLFAGLNGMGKSSVIQALLLLRQTYQKNMLSEGLELKDDLCNIGVAKDALYQSSPNDIIEIQLSSEDGTLNNWSFKVDDKKLSDTFLKIAPQPSNINSNNNIKNLSLFNNKFQYLSAFRNGPTQDYDKDTSSVELFNQISKKEGRCELVAHYLDFFKDKPVFNELLKKNINDDSSLIVQVKNWLEEISPGISIHIEPLESSYRLNYSFSRGPQKTSTDKFKALNIGFGVSYALPIVVATLSAQKNSLIIIENPEAHIHPHGQANLMKLLSLAAKCGVQIIIETHSDHIINGLLVSTKNGLISPSDSAVYFFDRDLSTHSTRTKKLSILSDGKIKNTPSGFFDQIDKDMESLMGF